MIPANISSRTAILWLPRSALNVRFSRRKRPPAAEESAVSVPAEDAAPSNVITISQPADNGTVIVMIGQRVECVCGACYPVEGGTVIGFEDVPDGRFFRGGVFALIRWDSRPDRPERVRLSDIHRRGWRSAGGSPLGVFVAG